MGRLSGAVRSNLATPEKWVVDWFNGGVNTPAGVQVSEDTALHYSPYFAGVRIISEDVGSLPFPVYQRLDPRGKERRRDHPVHGLLNEEANPVMSGQALREILTGHAITWGYGTAEIVRDARSGRATALWPLRPDRMTVKRFGPGKRHVGYEYNDPYAGIVKTFTRDEILAVHGFGFDGVRGYSVVEMARRSIGLGVAAETYGSRFFGGDGQPSGVLTHPGTVGDTARKNMEASWRKAHGGGPDNAQRIAILEEGVTWKQIGLPPGDTQFLETRKYNVIEMARWLRIQPHKLGELDRATWNNIESENISYVTDTLRVWLTRWESSTHRRLFAQDERRSGLFAEHVIEGLLRGDMKSRFEGYRIGREIGVYSADDILEMENRNPLPDGKGEVYFVPLNWVPAPTPDDGPPLRDATRSTRSTESRRRIARAFLPLLADADERVAKIERTQVGKLLKAHFAKADEPALTDFLAALDDLYEGEVLDQTVARWMPPLTALASEIAAEAAFEVAHEDVPDLDSWTGEYVAAHSAYRIGSAKRQIAAIARDLIDTPADLRDAVQAHLETQVAERPGKAATWEATQMSNSAARETWRAAGVKKLIWDASGETCPYCTGLDGKTVGIEVPFAEAGSTIEGDDENPPIDIKRNTFAPPVHPGCDCSINPA